MTFPQPHTLKCGCIATVSHRKGPLRFTCSGGGSSTPEGVVSIDRAKQQTCPGGVTHEIVAVPSITYTSRVVTEGGAA